MATKDDQHPNPGIMSPQAVIQYIWMLSGLNVSTPKTRSSRNQYLASASFQSASKALRINRERVTISVPLTGTDPMESTYVSGVVRDVVPGPYSNRLMLSGDRKHTYWIKCSEWNDSISSLFGSYSNPIVPSKPTWILGKITISTKGYIHLSSLGALTINSYYLIESLQTAETINQLIDHDRRFFIGLPFDAPPPISVPSAILTDEQPPRYLYTLPVLDRS